jgi:hypothetical protein
MARLFLPTYTKFLQQGWPAWPARMYFFEMAVGRLLAANIPKKRRRAGRQRALNHADYCIRWFGKKENGPLGAVQI